MYHFRYFCVFYVYTKQKGSDIMNSNENKGVFHVTTKAQKWGNSIGVRIPFKVAEKYGLVNGSPIELEQKESGIFVKPIDQVPTLEELMAGITEGNEHNEIVFGKPEGDEVW